MHRRALIIEDDTNLAETLAQVLLEFAATVDVAHCMQDALRHFTSNPAQIVLTDFALPDGTALDLLAELAELGPSPLIISMSGAADTTQGFALAQRGVQAFIPKPCSLAEVRRVIAETLAVLPDVNPSLRAVVGRIPLEELETTVRRTVVHEALAQSGGSVNGAARLLGISRQRLQYIIRTTDDVPPC
jgi:two-component system, response regulator RegA